MNWESTSSTAPHHIVDYLGLFGTAEPWPGMQAHGFEIFEPGQSHHQAMIQGLAWPGLFVLSLA